MKSQARSGRQSGFLLIEVLVTLVILLLGLLGLAGLLTRAHQAETESYERVQALTLIRDMSDRINANRGVAATYITPTSAPLGKGATKDCSAPVTTADIDLCQWHAALLGASETAGGACNAATGANCVGSMIDARGCITNPSANVYLLQIVWQGLTQTTNPPTSVACGSGLYGSESTAATAGLRRAVTTVVQIGNLTAP